MEGKSNLLLFTKSKSTEMIKNIKTTLTGLLTGGAISLDAIVNQGITHGWKQALVGVAVILLGAFAKDHNVTGGTTQ